MAVTTQQGNLQAMSDLTGLTHDIFVGKVVNNVRRDSPTAQLFKDAPAGMYRLEGQYCKFAADFRYKTGAMATDGNIPDYTPMDAVQGRLSPVRRSSRIALDNLVELQAAGPGAFDDLNDRIFTQLWDAWASMEARQAIGGSSGLIGKCESRSSDTTFVIKDAYGNSDTNPLSHISEGSILAWWDLTSTAAIDGAGKVSTITESTRTIVMDSAATWEPADTLAADDLIYFATTNNISNDHFISERNLAPNGLGTIIDPTASASTVFNIAEATYPRSKPYRKSSSTFNHLELTEHWLQLGQKRGFDVSPETDVVITFPSCVAQIARSLMGYQQQAYTGGNLEGGYQMVHVSGIPLLQDNMFYHDVAMTVCKEQLFRTTLGGDADFFSGDGSMWNRIENYDGKDAYVVDYMNYLSPYRGAHAALTGISTDVTDANWTHIPDY